AALTLDFDQLPGLPAGAAVGNPHPRISHLTNAPGAIPEKAPVVRDGRVNVGDDNGDMKAGDLRYGHDVLLYSTGQRLPRTCVPVRASSSSPIAWTLSTTAASSANV